MNKKKIYILLPLIALLSPLVEAGEGTPISSPIYENGSRLDYQACRVLVRRGEILPMSDLMTLAKKRSTDHILDAFLLKQNDRYFYQIEAVGDNGIVNIFYMDATSGELLQNLGKSE
ncbi:PepSY domain-containing protein [Neptunomonas antarctica]|uniref:Peptidase propeptide and YPEB domain-containing protein n=1 Tax=Neptunomonas antarctica TaxID=619304 RepID=A0A1N7J483_9GAMM|nr:hypothetical protein [Neptunomonas antarctica]SIS44031.1 hypothetical protein SAMN05421760_101568 [Neptunomonas antarctica]